MSKDNIRSHVGMILEVTRPIYSRHAWNAHAIRQPEKAQEFDQRAAMSDFMETIEECAKVFLDMATQHATGFITDFSLGLKVKKLSVTSEIVQAQTTNAYHMVSLFTRVAFHRMTSMMYHTHGLGQTAALCSSDDLEYATAVSDLRFDCRIYLDILHKGRAQAPFLLGLITGSFSLCELCGISCSSSPFPLWPVQCKQKGSCQQILRLHLLWLGPNENSRICVQAHA